jgi:protein-tyrosine phosphatase
MKIMFVCTGNVCRSPMGELLLKQRLAQNNSANTATNTATEKITITSAGIRALPGHPIDPSSGKLMEARGIDASAFRSTRLTAPLVEAADLILCFEKTQRTAISTQVPLTARRTFLLTEFADICQLGARGDFIEGATLADRFRSAIAAAPLCRPTLPPLRETEDPIGQNSAVFERVEREINGALSTILAALGAGEPTAPAGPAER